MQRMTGIDPMFIYSDTPETPMEIAYACVFDPATAAGGYTFERVTGRARGRGSRPCTPFRRRLMPVPLGLDHPRWVDDPDFDLDNHLHRVALPAPGGDAEFRGMVAEVMGRPLTPEQPPWEMHVVEGLAGGMVGLIAKVHHSVIDGVAGAADAGPAARPDAGGQRRDRALPALDAGAACRRSAQLMTDALPTFITEPHPGAARRARGRPHRRAPGPLRGRRPARARVDPARVRPPRSSRRSAPAGRCRFAELDMATVRALKDRFGVDDQRRGARRLLRGAAHPPGGARPGRREPAGGRRARLGARRRRDDAALGNQLSAMFVPLANDRKTPLERLRTVTAASASCKGQERAVGYGPMATRLAEAVPPALAKPMIQLGVALGRPAQAAGGQPHGLQRARARLPALLRRHGAARRCTRSAR